MEILLNPVYTLIALEIWIPYWQSLRKTETLCGQELLEAQVLIMRILYVKLPIVALY